MHAHNPLSALYYLEVKKDFSIITINLSQNGLHEALRKHYSDMDLEGLSDVDYKQLAVKYVKENFELKINKNDIQLLEGGVKLGSHQSDMKFITTTLPKRFKHLDVNIKAFSENEHHQTVFSLLLNGHTSKVVLNESNNYERSVVFKDNMMVVVDSESFNRNYLWCLVLIPIVMVGKKLMTKSARI